MAAPPNLPPVPSSFSNFLGDFHPLTDTHYTAMDAQQLQNGSQHLIPPLAPTPPPAAPSALDMVPPTPILPSHPEEHLNQRRRSADRSRRASQQDGRSPSRSGSRSRSSEHSASDDGDSEDEESSDPRYQWRPIAEDKSEPCEDEMTYIESRAATEHSALDHAYWEEQTFFELNDEQIKPLESGRIDWLVERFNGTKDEPNNERIMRSPIVRIGGYDWRIVFHPKGNLTEFLSVYVECVTIQQPEFADTEPFDELPFPFLAGEGTDQEPPSPFLPGKGAVAIKKRRSVAAQLSVVMYNPSEPRTNEHKMDAHRFSKTSHDFGWRYFAHRDDFYMRRHGQRQALLRDDKLAFKAYIRIIDEPTRCMWADNKTDSFTESLLTTSLRPFTSQLPGIVGLIPLFHFHPIRRLITQLTPSRSTIYNLQTILWKLYSRTKSPFYGRNHDSAETTDAVACLKSVVDALDQESDKEELVKLLGSLDPEKGALVGTNKLQTKDCGSVQDAINMHTGPIETPALLAIELRRHDFDREQRKWKKLTNRVSVDDFLTVSDGSTSSPKVYQLYAVVTHVGDLQSNKHNVYVRPVPTVSGGSGLWYGYQDRRVKAMTTKQAITDHEGFDAKSGDTDQRRDSPFSGIHGIHEAAENEVIYLALYTDSSPKHPLPKEEAWAVPEDIRKGLQFSKQKESPKPCPSADKPAELAFREEQLRFEQESRAREIAEMEAGGPSTPEWPLTDEEGDTVMSDAEDGSPLHYSPTNDMAASVTLTPVPTKPSRSHKWHTTIDSLGRDYYKGQMFGDKYQGEGHLVTTSGDEYVGNFYQGKREGYGKMVYAANGNVYEGEWLKDQHHGQGKLTEAATGNVFEGGWKEGKKHGQFVLKGQVTEEDRGLCTICYEREMTTAFYDCGHVVACKECAARIDNCPMCRRRVVGRLQLYGVKMTLE